MSAAARTSIVHDSPHRSLMHSLQNRHADIAALLRGPTILLDIPVYGNIGDLLIFHGTLEFLRKCHYSPRMIASALDFQNYLIDEKDTILFQGGGNLGDLYPLHQTFREQVIGTFTENRIIILPQTIHFDSEKEYERCCNIFSAHPDLHLFVRDEHSLDLARKMTPNAYLMPDMSHQLYPIKHHSKNTGTLFLKRMDHESKELEIVQPADRMTDWHPMLNTHLFYIKGLAWMMWGSRCLPESAGVRLFLARIWIRYSRYLISKAVELFASYERIVTDRLHGHLLACLMDKPNTVLDNRYGKNSGYLACWSGKSELVEISPAIS